MLGEDLFSGVFARPWALTQEASSFRDQERSQLTCALLSGRWKYLYRETAAHELYDLEGAGEGVDVLAGAAIPEAERDELMQNLRALGYVDEE